MKNGSCKRTGSLSGILSSTARVSVDYCSYIETTEELKERRANVEFFHLFLFCLIKNVPSFGQNMRQGFLNELLTIICQTCGFCQQNSEKCLELFVWFSLDCPTIIVSVCLYCWP